MCANENILPECKLYHCRPPTVMHGKPETKRSKIPDLNPGMINRTVLLTAPGCDKQKYRKRCPRSGYKELNYNILNQVRILKRIPDPNKPAIIDLPHFGKCCKAENAMLAGSNSHRCQNKIISNHLPKSLIKADWDRTTLIREKKLSERDQMFL